MPPKIYKSLDDLKPKLKQYEPQLIDRRIGSNATVVFAVKYLKFNSKLPILDEDAFKTEESEDDSSDVDDDSDTEFLQRAAQREIVPSKTVGNKNKKKRKSQVDKNASDEERVARVGIDNKRTSDNRENSDRSTDKVEIDKERIEERRIDKEQVTSQAGCVEIESDEKESDTKESDERETIASEIVENGIDDGDDLEDELGDRLVVTGPEEDEFRQYDDDDEDESVISRNLKKIRSGPPPPPPKPKPLPKPQRPPVRAPQPYQSPQKATPQQSTSVTAATPCQEPPTQQGPTVADISKYLEDKNLRLLLAELNRHKDIFKLDEAARLILKKTMFLCIELDASDELMKFIQLVFEYNYSSDSKFWEELIGKLKRKDNPHAKCHSFKSKMDPTLVLRCYQQTIQEIAKHFDATNPTLTLSWLTYRYLFESTQRPKQNGTLTTPMPTRTQAVVSYPTNQAVVSYPMNQAVVIHPMNQALMNYQARLPATKNESKAQENLDPADAQRNVLYFKDADGEHKFRIKIPKREAKFSAKLLII